MPSLLWPGAAATRTTASHPLTCLASSGRGSRRSSIRSSPRRSSPLVGDVVTQIVQSDARYANVDLLYASLQAERLRTAPRANPSLNGMTQALLTVAFIRGARPRRGARGVCVSSLPVRAAEMDSVNRYDGCSTRSPVIPVEAVRLWFHPYSPRLNLMYPEITER